jgi:ABC-type Na+ transport system ATPase subunit NatA
MILDEPTTGLDVLASQMVLQFMRHSKREGKCVVFSTHNMLDADQLCDRVAVMHQGKIIALDTPANLKQQTHTQNLADAFLQLVGEPKVEEL